VGHSSGGRCFLPVIFEGDWVSQAPSEENEVSKQPSFQAKSFAITPFHTPFYMAVDANKASNELDWGEFHANPQIHKII
jgi:hypothetical protein